MAVTDPVSRAPRPSLAKTFDVVALAASAGGIEALSTVLRGLPRDFPAAVLVLQHLRATSAFVDVLRRQTVLPVKWATDGAEIAPGSVLVCPPLHTVDVHPDGTCSVSARRNLDKPIDAALEALADSYRARALAVVLTGMLNDGAAGIQAIKQAGGTVIVQSEDTAEQPAMPRAAIATGAVDLVLPLSEIGPVLAHVVAGGALPRPRDEIEAVDALFGAPGAMPAVLRSIDWAATPLGPVASWPPSLSVTVRNMLESQFPTCVYWGPDFIQLYNDAYVAHVGPKHPAAAGRPAASTWGDAWPEMRARFERVLATREAISVENDPGVSTARGLPEESYSTFSLSPIRDERQEVAGLLLGMTDTTARVLAERRMRTLRALATCGAGATTVQEAYERAAQALGEDGLDLPFALLYELHPSRARANLVATTGVEPGSFAAPRVLELVGDRPIWPLQTVVEEALALVVGDLTSRFGGPIVGPWPEPILEALVLPLRTAPDELTTGVLIAGLSPRRLLDGPYRSFLELVAAQIAASVGEARSVASDRQRLRALAELERAKSEFFANVSQEFRTPLTLTLGPLEHALARPEALPDGLAEELDLAARNARRLLGLVNSLLDFARAEAKRLEPRFEPVDLAATTIELADLFREATEQAGLALVVACPALSAPAWVDREMWEKIVSHLLANALKFTFEGEIRIELRERAQHAELVVRDTGIGIPQDDLPHIFERFHRVRGARARTHEGSGIGLALVRELVRLHNGRVRVTSEEGRGTTFTVWVPLVRRPQDARPSDLEARDRGEGAPRPAVVLAEAALGWIRTSGGEPVEASSPTDDDVRGDEPLYARAAGAHVLVVDDNADMRAYLSRLLTAAQWRVEAAEDGEAALEHMRRARPDLVLADVMMPKLDGFELLRRVRQEDGLKTTPVILLTARAGEAAAVEGLLAGADDYIAKPFTARELVARVGAQLDLARVRRRVARLDAYRVALSDALRPLSDPNAIQAEACRVLGDYLGASRVFYADPNRIESSEVAPALRGGRTLVFTDVESDPRLGDDERRSWRAAHATAAVVVPLVKNGAFVGAFTVIQATARPWTDDEIAIVEETAERTWAALERARAEAALAKDLEDTRLLRDLSARLVSETDMQVLHHEIVAAAVALTGADAGTIQMLDEPSQEFILLATQGIEPFLLERFHRVRASSGTSCGVALSTGGRVFLDFDVPRSADPDGSLRVHFDAGFRSAQSTPLVTRAGRTIGMLSTHWRTHRRATERELRFLDLLARQAADLVERSQVDAALRESRSEVERQARFLDATLSSVQDFLQVWDRDKRLVFANRRMEALWGRTRERYVGKTNAELGYAPEICTFLGENIDRVITTGESIRGEIAAVSFAGTPGDFEYVFSPVLGADGAVDQVVLLSRDVTERRAAVDAVRASEATFRGFFDLAAVGMVQADVETGHILRANHKACQMLGYERDEIVGARFVDLTHPEDREADWRAFRTAMASATPHYHVEKRLVRKDGSTIWVKVSVGVVKDAGRPARTAAVIEDITERKRSEAALQALNETLERRVAERTRDLRDVETGLRALVLASAQIVWVTDAEGRIVEDSPSWRAFTGQTTEAFLGWGWLDAVHPDDDVERQWREAVASHTPVDARFRLRHVSGAWRMVRVRAVPLRNEDGSVRGWIGMNTDEQAP